MSDNILFLIIVAQFSNKLIVSSVSKTKKIGFCTNSNKENVTTPAMSAIM